MKSLLLDLTVFLFARLVIAFKYISLIDLKFLYTDDETFIFSFKPTLLSVFILDLLALFCLWKAFDEGNYSFIWCPLFYLWWVIEVYVWVLWLWMGLFEKYWLLPELRTIFLLRFLASFNYYSLLVKDMTVSEFCLFFFEFFITIILLLDFYFSRSFWINDFLDSFGWESFL